MQYIIRKAFDCAPDGKVCRKQSRYIPPLTCLDFPCRSSRICLGRYFGDRKNNSLTALGILGLTGANDSNYISQMRDLLNVINRIKTHADQTVSDEDFSERTTRWPVDTPDTKEAYFIREIFEGKS